VSFVHLSGKRNQTSAGTPDDGGAHSLAEAISRVQDQFVGRFEPLGVILTGACLPKVRIATRDEKIGFIRKQLGD
jgi:hypothetical protein